MTVTLYSDEHGKSEVWRGSYSPFVTKGIFSIQLGSGNYPLPKNDAMGQALWLGISVNGSEELRPLTPVAASAYALSVADGAITSRKMGTDYVSSVQINGQQVTSRGGAANFLPGQGISMSYDSTAQGILINTQQIQTPTANTYGSNWWGEKGNNSTTPGTNYVGTSDSVALEIHVNDAGTASSAGRVMVFYPYAASPDIVGGFKSNSITLGKVGNFIGGGGYASNINSSSGNYGSIGGGANNTLYYDYSTIAGGQSNSAGGGPSNGPAFVGGGQGNSAVGYGVAGGGLLNEAGNYGVVGGGEENWDFADHDFIGGGGFNQIASNYTAGENFDVIAGGETNKISPTLSANAVSSAIRGGLQNGITGSYSAIPGGLNLGLGAYSFGFNGDNSGNATTITTHIGNNVAYFGNVNLLIGNVDGTARQLQFYSPNSGGYSYPSTSYYTSFQAGTQTADINYTLPTAQGAANSLLADDGAGNLFWAPGFSNTAWTLLGNAGTVDLTNFLGTTDNVPLTIRVNNIQALRLEPNSASPDLIGGYSGNAISSIYSGSVICGGGFAANANTNSSNYGAIVGGTNNTIQAGATFGGTYYPTDYNFIGGGSGNTAVFGGVGVQHSYDNTQYSVIVGGQENQVSEGFTFIGGGSANLINEEYSAIAGGQSNTLNSPWGVISGGLSNIINTSANYGFIGGGNTNTVGPNSGFAAIVGGKGNQITASGGFNFIGGGLNNLIQDQASPLVQSAYNNITGGVGLIAQGYCETVIGRYNTIVGTSSAVSIIPNDPILIVGNGVSGTPHNAFEVSNSGHSVVYDNTKPTTPTTLGVTPVILGATYVDNVIYGWGSVTGSGSMVTSFGALPSVSHTAGSGVYVITLSINDQNGTSITLNNGAVTASIGGVGLTDPGCGTIAVSTISGNTFTVWTHNTSCALTDLPFSFHVTGRP